MYESEINCTIQYDANGSSQIQFTFRQTQEMLTIHHFTLLLFKNYLIIQVGMLQKLHQQYERYESALDDTLLGTESLRLVYLTHKNLKLKTLSRYLKEIADDMEDMAPDYEPIFINVYQYYGNLQACFLYNNEYVWHTSS